MERFNIEIEELLQKVVTVEAENREEAIKLIKEEYKNENIILDENDFKGVSFKNV